MVDGHAGRGARGDQGSAYRLAVGFRRAKPGEEDGMERTRGKPGAKRACVAVFERRAVPYSLAR